MQSSKVIYVGLFLLLIASSAMPIIFQSARLSPFTYVADEYTDRGIAIYYPEGPVCVGGIVKIPIHIRVDRVPTTIRLDDQLSDLATKRSVLWSVVDYPASSYVEPVDVQAVIPIQLPDTLPPGVYRYVVVARSDGTSETGFLSDITVQDCK